MADPDDGGQHNNRLLRSETFENNGLGARVERRWYGYGPDGNLGQMVRKIEAESNYRVTWLYYDTSGHVWLAASAVADYDEVEGIVTNPVGISAMEYRYDSGRARYMTRPRHPDTLALLPGAQWRDHAGDEVFGDYTVDAATGVTTGNAAYNIGIGFEDLTQSSGPTYFHAD